MRNTITSTSWLIITVIGIFSLFIGSTEEQQPPMAKPKITAIDIPETLTFAGETVPLEDFDVKERLDRELLVNSYFHSQTIYYIKMANRWLPVIEPILKENNIHDDFKYLALAESGLQDVASPKRAAGVWQFLRPTALEYGLEVNNEVDERYHLEKATVAACKYMHHAFKKFGSWSMVAASYNCGMSRLEKTIEAQKTNNYFNLYLNTETSRYVFRILALKMILDNPEAYGFYLEEHDLYPPIPYETIKVDTPINSLPDFAKAHNMNYKELKLLNPWLTQPHLLNPNRKNYEIKVAKVD